jgi:hypothetical protein
MNIARQALWLLAVVVIWDAVWKAISLWKAARNGQKGWYIALLLLNTVGLLPIVYIQFFQKKPAIKK